MKSKKIKGDIGAVKADIRPYLKKHFSTKRIWMLQILLLYAVSFGVNTAMLKSLRIPAQMVSHILS